MLLKIVETYKTWLNLYQLSLFPYFVKKHLQVMITLVWSEVGDVSHVKTIQRVVAKSVYINSSILCNFNHLLLIIGLSIFFKKIFRFAYTTTRNLFFLPSFQTLLINLLWLCCLLTGCGLLFVSAIVFSCSDSDCFCFTKDLEETKWRDCCWRSTSKGGWGEKKKLLLK